jgi:endonuclease G
MDLAATQTRRWYGAGPPAKAHVSPAEKVRRAKAAPTIASRFKFLTADGQTATPLEQEALLGTNDLVEASFIDRCRIVMTCVGRLRFTTPRGRSYATGFLIAPGLIMTNHHVFGTAEAAEGASIEFDYKYDIAGKLTSGPEFDLRPDLFFVADDDLDFAVVAVAPVSTAGARLDDRGYLRLNGESGKAKEGDFVTIVQHPDGLPMRIALRENEVTRARLDEDVVWYQADTAHGSSGAAVFNDSFQIAALHSSGRIKRNDRGEYALARGGWAATLDGLGESDVIWEANVGFRVSRICPRLLALAKGRSADYHRILHAAMAGGDVLAESVDRVNEDGNVAEDEDMIATGAKGEGEMPGKTVRTAQTARTDYTTIERNGTGLIVPLQLRISMEMASGANGTYGTTVTPVGDTGVGARPPKNGGGHVGNGFEDEAFEMRIPVIFDGLDERTGFDRSYLEFPGGKDVPMPKITTAGKKVLAPLVDGSGHELRYHKFSVWMQKDRRLALFTASNVDWRNRASIVDGKKVNRDSLAGFPPNNNFAEQWVSDTRISDDHQLPDVFYTDDRGAFDKGHLVRRDDVCWGTTFEDIQMGNGDTYHVTNCSPQTKPFNQGQHGEENWGDLETHIQKATKADAEKVVIYAGPIFRADDRWFRGKDDTGPARIQIPTKFWKIVVTKRNGHPAAYGFELEQDVRQITEEEFFVTDEWIGSMRRLSDLQKKLRGWLNLDDLLDADQFDVVHGNQ